jgi:hypothetical protein
MLPTNSRFAAIGLSLGLLLLAAAPASALNDFTTQSCDPTCATKPPKASVFVAQGGDLDGTGAGAPVTATLAKGGKKTVVKVTWTYEWFSAGATFRSFVVKLNGKFPTDFTVISNLDSCPSGSCLRGATTWFDLDFLEATYPGQIIGQPLVVTLTSARTADAGGTYQSTMAVDVVKKK